MQSFIQMSELEQRRVKEIRFDFCPYFYWMIVSQNTTFTGDMQVL